MACMGCGGEVLTAGCINSDCAYSVGGTYHASWWEALYEKLTGRPHPARTPLPACGMRGCIETYAHSHAPDTGWIRPEGEADD